MCSTLHVCLAHWLSRLPPAIPEHHCRCVLPQADFVSRGMWEGAITKGMTRQEQGVLKAPLVYAEIMSFIKVRTGRGVLGMKALCLLH